MAEIAAMCPREDRIAERRVFPGSRQIAKNVMARACKTAGIVHRHPHDLRHRYASVQIGRGVPVTQVAASSAIRAHARHLQPRTSRRGEVMRRARSPGLRAALPEPEERGRLTGQGPFRRGGSHAYRAACGRRVSSDSRSAGADPIKPDSLIFTVNCPGTQEFRVVGTGAAGHVLGSTSIAVLLSGTTTVFEDGVQVDQFTVTHPGEGNPTLEPCSAVGQSGTLQIVITNAAILLTPPRG